MLPRIHHRRAAHASILVSLVALAALVTLGCREARTEDAPVHLNPNMDDQKYLQAQDEAQILNIVNVVASENFQVAQGAPSTGELSTAISSYCVCPGATGAQVSCNATCGDNSAPTQLYTISATKQFVGIMLPEMTLSGAIDVVAP